MKVLLTGCLGYIGSVFSKFLQNDGYDIIGLDKGYYADCNLYKTFDNYKIFNDDIRKFDNDILSDVETVIHLAGLSNDPLGEFNKKITWDINHKSTVNLAKISKSKGVKRFIFVSSQSIYGISDTDIELCENDKKNPITEYAKTKYQAELDIKKLADDDFTIICLRPATVFGASPRLRCDIVFNNFLGSAFTRNIIEIKSDGTPWRPIIHVKDLSNALIASINLEKNICNKKSYNIGKINGNYSVKEIADVVNMSIKGSKIVYSNEHGKDARSYRVSFDQFYKDFPKKYLPNWSLQDAAYEMLDVFKEINFKENEFLGRKTNRLIQLKWLLENNLINKELL